MTAVDPVLKAPDFEQMPDPPDSQVLIIHFVRQAAEHDRIITAGQEPKSDRMRAECRNYCLKRAMELINGMPGA